MSRHLIVAVVLSAFLSTGAFAQDEKKKKNKNQKNTTQARLTKQLMSNFSKVEMTDDQEAAAKKILSEGMKNLVAIQKEVEAMFTKEQRQKRNEVMKQMREDGVKGKEVTEKANKAAGMDAAAMKKFAELKKKQNQAATQLRKKITDLLTDDQKKAMRAGQKKGKAGGKAGGKGKDKS